MKKILLLSLITLINMNSFAASYVNYGENIAHTKKATFEPDPNYHLTKSLTDNYDLTDGNIVSGEKIWGTNRSVGWRNLSFGGMTIDLGAISEIGKIRYHTGAGIAGVHWPEALYLLLSEDGVKYYLVGEMMEVNRQIIPSYGNLKNLWLESSTINTKARFVRVIFTTDRYHFVDEIEIIKTNSKKLKALNTYPPVSSSIVGFIKNIKSVQRQETDIKLLKQNAEKYNIDISNQLSELNLELTKHPEWTKVSQSLVPVNIAQGKILKINQTVLKRCRFNGIVKWVCSRWTPIDIFSWPKLSSKSFNIYMMNGERRSAVINLTNAEPQLQTVSFSTEGKVEIKPYSVVCTDTKNMYMISSMLKELKASPDKTYHISLEPGATRQIWFEFCPEKLEPGQHFNKVVFTDSSSFEYTVHINKASFPDKFSLVVSMWDYLHNIPSKYPGINADNINALMKILHKHRFNDLWATSPIIPDVDANDFDDNDNLIKDLDFAAFDKWLERFSGNGMRFLFFNNIGASGNNNFFAGIDPQNAPDRFSRRISSYFEKFEKHLVTRGWSPKNFGILWRDECNNAEQFKILNLAAEAIRNSGSKQFKIFSNPRPNVIKEMNQAMLKNTNFLSPEYPMPQNYEDLMLYFKIRQKMPEENYFGFYRCNDQVRQLSPYSYYLFSFWTGMLFDNFGIMSFWSLIGAPNGYKDYDYQDLLVSPLFFDKNEIFSSKHMEAIYEGREDYEYFILLKNSIAKLYTINPSLAEKYSKCLTNILTRIRARHKKYSSDWLYWKHFSNVYDIGFDSLRKEMWVAINEIYQKYPDLLINKK